MTPPPRPGSRCDPAVLPLSEHPPDSPIVVFGALVSAVNRCDYQAARRYQRRLNTMGYNVLVRPWAHDAISGSSRGIARSDEYESPATPELVAGPSNFRRGQGSASTPPRGRTSALHEQGAVP